MKTKFRRVFHIILISLGCLQFAGYVFKNSELRGLGIAYCVGPLPTVFSTINGVEGFSAVHTIHFTDDKGNAGIIKLDQHVFSQFNGHFFLKNAYSLFLAYPHILKPRQVADGVNFSLCKRNIFYRFGIKNKIENPSIQIEQSRFNTKENIILIPKCKD